MCSERLPPLPAWDVELLVQPPKSGEANMRHSQVQCASHPATVSAVLATSVCSTRGIAQQHLSTRGIVQRLLTTRTVQLADTSGLLESHADRDWMDRRLH